MPFDTRLLVNQPHMADCLERLLYETMADERRSENEPGWAGHFAKLVKCDNLDPNYVFKSPYAMLKQCNGKPLLHLAIMFDRADIVAVLLSRDAGASPDCSREPHPSEALNDDPFERTAIYQSLSMSRTDIFAMLLNAGCDVSGLDSFNCSLLWHAVNTGRWDKIFAILTYSPSGHELLNIPDRSGLLPLHVSVINNDPTAAELLLSAGATVDATQSEGATALCFAAKRGTVQVMKTLLMHGANPNHTPSEAFSKRSFFGDSAVAVEDTICFRLRNGVSKCTPVVPAAFAVDARCFRKSSTQICSALAILLTCGARLPRSMELPKFVPCSLVALNCTPANLQIQCCLAIRRKLLVNSQGRSVKPLAERLPIPESLINLVCFDFLKQFW